MNTTTSCPQTEELQQLLDGSLNNSRQQECTDHMDRCRGCQERLEEIATEGTNLSKLVEHLNTAEPVAESAYWPALDALDKDFQQTVVPRPAGRSREVSLDFLEPATDAAYLGRLAQFDVMRVLGRGGMGIVLEAFDSCLQRNVALKVLDPDLAGDEIARQRFCREARAAASITHENVVAVHQVEKATDTQLPYLVMQLVAGESLEQRLTRETKLPYREIVRIGMQAAQGLAAAHSQSLIHRDIKPGNIMLETATDRVKLTDFGLARVADDVKLTRTGFISGTPLYMAPEQAMGEDADHRSDLFSLGAVLYEMCAGVPPFAGNSALAILKQIADSKHRPLRELNPEVPGWLANTIDRLLEKKPANRIQSASHLAELLEFEWALMKTSSEDVPVVCQEAARKRAKRSRLIAAGVGATFLALGLLGGILLAPRGNGPATVAPGSFEEVQASPEQIAVLSAKSGAVWSVSFNHNSQKMLMGVEDGSVRVWDLPSKSVIATLSAHRGGIGGAKFSHRSDLFATGGEDGMIKLWNPGQTEPVKMFSHHHTVRSVAFSQDDAFLFAGDKDGQLRVWPISGNAEKTASPLAQTQQPGTVNTVAISPDGETLATAGSDKIVRLWNAKTLTLKQPLEGHTAPVYGLAFDRAGVRLASVGWDKMVRVWDVSSGQILKSWEGQSGDIWGVAFSPDGKKLATAGLDGTVKLWDAESTRLLATYRGHGVAIHSLTFNRDGTLIASGGRDGAVRVWKVQ